MHVHVKVAEILDLDFDIVSDLHVIYRSTNEKLVKKRDNQKEMVQFVPLI